MIACSLLFVINISRFHCCDLEVITSRCKIGCHWLFRLQRLKKILFQHNGECELFFKLFFTLRGRRLKGKGKGVFWLVICWPSTKRTLENRDLV